MLLAALRGGGRPYRLSYTPRHATVEEWLGSQQRFAHLFRPESAGLVRRIQEQVDADWNALVALCDEAPA